MGRAGDRHGFSGEAVVQLQQGGGVRERNPHHKVNTTTLYDEMEEIEGEDAVAFIVPAHGYRAVFKDCSTRPLAVWCVTEGGRMFGVTLTSDGRPPLSIDNVEDEESFDHYEQGA